MSAAKKKKSTVKVKKKSTLVKKTSVKKKKTTPKKKTTANKAPVVKKKAASNKSILKNNSSVPEKTAEVEMPTPETSGTVKPGPQKENVDSVFVLDAVMAINKAKDVHQELSNYSNLQSGITIDASQVEMIDTAIFQLLVAFVIKIKSNNAKISWKSPSTEFLERASLLNLSHALCLNVVET